jgi:soluble lytic murein transglycosylase-like protein
VSLSKLTVSALLLSSSLLEAQKSVPQSDIGSIAKQMASVRQQLLSVEVQRQSIAKQEASLHGVSKQTAFLEPLRLPAQYLDCDALAPRETDKLIAKAARTQSVSADLLRAVVRQESAFRPCAVSEKGAQGLMQLMPATAAAFNVDDPFDPQQNILGGAAYLRQLMQRYAGDASLALSAYNAGPQIVDRIAGIPDIPETQNYVASIFRDLGWTLPVRPMMLPENGFEQAEADTDVRIDASERESSTPEIGPQQKFANTIKDKPATPFSPLP